MESQWEEDGTDHSRQCLCSKRASRIARPSSPRAASREAQLELTPTRLIFRHYVGEMLAPTLAPGDIVVMDNLSAHKGAAIRGLIEARGATLLYLPAYSPDHNPIELIFAKLKHLLRSAAARTVDRLWTVLGGCLRHFAPDECARYLRHCGLRIPGVKRP